MSNYLEHIQQPGDWSDRPQIARTRSFLNFVMLFDNKLLGYTQTAYVSPGGALRFHSKHHEKCQTPDEKNDKVDARREYGFAKM